MARQNKKVKNPGVILPEFDRRFAVAMQELRRSAAASPHANKARYSRAAVRRERQRGDWS